MATLRPPPPGNIRVQGEPKSSGMSTHRKYSVNIKADINGISGEPKKNQVRLHVQWSTDKHFSSKSDVRSEYGAPNRTEKVKLEGLRPNTRYYFRAFTAQKNIDQNKKDNPGDNVKRRSKRSSGDFWTERPARSPDLSAPPENAVIPDGVGVQVTWKHRDADTPEDDQLDAQVQWRTAPTLFERAGQWQGVGVIPSYPGAFVRPVIYPAPTGESFTIPSATLSGGVHYEWRVRTRDEHLQWYGPWSEIRSFFVDATTLPPRPLSPIDGEAEPLEDDVQFTWQHRNPSGLDQEDAEIRYRVEGTTLWTTVADIGTDESTDVDATGFTPGYQYEWQARTSASPGVFSGWSKSEFFWPIGIPGTGEVVEPDDTLPQDILGSGTYECYIYDQGGQVLRGKIEPIRVLRWHRKRDDISVCNIFTNGFGPDCCELLANIHSWQHEVVVFRDGVRVWEGPITRIGWHSDGVEIEARDVMAYVYRRVMRQGYNDNFQTGTAVGPRSTVDRAAIIIANALAPHDPNVLPWLTRFDYPDDAKEARIVQDWTRSAWEEVDDLAAHAGLDYTVVGRRIILHDTHRDIGRLPEMTSEDFFDAPIITEYGMSMANVFGVTNNSGVFGVAQVPPDQWGGLGPIEMLSSEYGEADASGEPQVLTAAQEAEKVEVLTKQAQRNLEGRWPFPTVVRIPDNTRLNPKATVGINQLVPGIWIPLRAKTICKEYSQMQKLDSISVEVLDDGDEKVRVVLSPAEAEDDAGPEIET